MKKGGEETRLAVVFAPLCRQLRDPDDGGGGFSTAVCAEMRRSGLQSSVLAKTRRKPEKVRTKRAKLVPVWVRLKKRFAPGQVQGGANSA